MKILGTCWLFRMDKNNLKMEDLYTYPVRELYGVWEYFRVFYLIEPLIIFLRGSQPIISIQLIKKFN